MRETVIDLHKGGVGQSEIARRLDIPLGTVATWLHRYRNGKYDQKTPAGYGKNEFNEMVIKVFPPRRYDGS